MVIPGSSFNPPTPMYKPTKRRTSPLATCITLNTTLDPNSNQNVESEDDCSPATSVSSAESDVDFEVEDHSVAAQARNASPSSSKTTPTSPSSNRLLTRPTPTRKPPFRPLLPLTPSPSPSHSESTHQSPQLPKSQPLARALFARKINDVPHAGMGIGAGGGGKKKSGTTTQKLIVPSKPFRTTFELGLTSSELARR